MVFGNNNNNNNNNNNKGIIWMSRVQFPAGAITGFFLFATTSRLALGPTQLPMQGVPGALSLGVKRLGREADNSPPSSA
jgi:hypothetical protein